MLLITLQIIQYLQAEMNYPFPQQHVVAIVVATILLLYLRLIVLFVE